MPEQTLPKRLLFLCLILASRTSCYIWTHRSHHWWWMIFCSWPWQLWPWSTTTLFWDLVPSIGSLVHKFLSLFHAWTNFDPWYLPAPSPFGPNKILAVHLWFFHKHLGLQGHWCIVCILLAIKMEKARQIEVCCCTPWVPSRISATFFLFWWVNTSFLLLSPLRDH